MLKLLFLLANVTIFASACVPLQPVREQAPLKCPPPPLVPPLQKLSKETTEPSFLERLDTILLPKLTEPTLSDSSSKPVSDSTKK